jgi:hypothetical protein
MFCSLYDNENPAPIGNQTPSPHIPPYVAYKALITQSRTLPINLLGESYWIIKRILDEGAKPWLLLPLFFFFTAKTQNLSFAMDVLSFRSGGGGNISLHCQLWEDWRLIISRTTLVNMLRFTILWDSLFCPQLFLTAKICSYHQRMRSASAMFQEVS